MIIGGSDLMAIGTSEGRLSSRVSEDSTSIGAGTACTAEDKGMGAQDNKE